MSRAEDELAHIRAEALVLLKTHKMADADLVKGFNNDAFCYGASTEVQLSFISNRLLITASILSQLLGLLAGESTGIKDEQNAPKSGPTS